MTTLFESQLKKVPLLFRGKVRDIYDLNDRLLLVTSDRLSAFDVVLPDPISGKGETLNRVTEFWMKKFSKIVPNQLTGQDPASVAADESEKAQLAGRSVIAWKTEPLPVECVVRGYLIGSGWKDYQATGSVCGIKLPEGLKLADQLPEPIFTPAYKAERGAHDENISFAKVCELIGEERANQIRDVSLALYREGAAFAKERGIIIADTKFEFGLRNGELTLIDEVMTPDSSRFWDATTYRPGISPPSFDKQIVRDYLETLDWGKVAPGPKLPAEIIAKTAECYRAVAERLMA